MPTLPIFNRGETVKTAAPGRTALMPALRGVSVDARTLMGAVETPRLDASGAIAEGRAGAAIGAAVSGVGDVMGKMAAEMAHNINIKKVADAHNIMTAADGEIATKFQQEQDPSKWAGIAEEHHATVKGLVLTKDLSPVAMEQIEMAVNRWSAHGIAEAKVAAFRESTKQADDVLEANQLNAEAAGNWEAANAFTAQRERTIGKAGVARLIADQARRKEIYENRKRVDEVKVATEEVVAKAAAHGQDEVIKDIESGKYKHLGPGDLERLRNAGQAVHADRTNAMMASVENGIAKAGESLANGNADDPGILTEAKIDAINSPFFSEHNKAQAKHYLAQQNDTTARNAAKLERETNGVRNAVVLRKQVMAYDPKTDPTREKYFQLVHDIGNRVEQSQAGELTGELYSKYGTNPPKDTEMRSIVQRNVSKSLDVTFDAFTGAIPYKTKTTNRMGLEVVTTDPAKEQLAIDAQSAVEMEMHKWYQANPSKANDLDEVSKALSEKLPVGHKKNLLQKLIEDEAGRKGSAGGGGAPGVGGGTTGLNDSLIETVKGFEGFAPSAVGDYNQTSVGYGTRAKGAGETITKEDAELRLRDELTSHARNIDRAASDAGLKLTPSQRDALISFDFNTGKGGYLIDSSKGDMAEIRRRLLLYRKAGGEVLSGLEKRREKEAAMLDQ